MAREGILRAQFHCRSFLLDHPNRLDFVKPQWPFHQYIFVAYRLVVALYFFAYIIRSGFHDGNEGAKWLIFLTNWSYTVETVHFLWSAGTALHYAIATAKDTYPSPPKRNRLPWYYRAQWAIHNIAIASALLVTVLYWALLYNPDANVSIGLDINMHALNGVFALVDLFVTSVPTRLFHIYHPLLHGVVYSVFAAIYWAAGGKGLRDNDYIYKVIDFGSEPGTAALYICLVALVAMPIVHVVVFCCYALRVFIARKCCHVGVDTVDDEVQEGGELKRLDDQNSA